MDLKVFRKNLRYLRRKHGFSQGFVADYLQKKSYTTVQKWEIGPNEPPFGDVLKLCTLYGISVDDIVSIDFEIADSLSLKTQKK